MLFPSFHSWCSPTTDGDHTWLSTNIDSCRYFTVPVGFPLQLIWGQWLFNQNSFLHWFMCRWCGFSQLNWFEQQCGSQFSTFVSAPYYRRWKSLLHVTTGNAPHQLPGSTPGFLVKWLCRCLAVSVTPTVSASCLLQLIQRAMSRKQTQSNFM